jgi:hypothetical protein
MAKDGKSGRSIETHRKSGEGWRDAAKDGMHFAIRKLISSLLAISMHCHIDALRDVISHVALARG